MQIVGYESVPGGDTEQAQLLIADDGVVDAEPLIPGAELAYSLGDRHCAGTIDGAVHTPCTDESAPYCDRHTKRFACARCRGDCEMPLSTCHEEHAVYLAAFAPATFKVGVTRSWRLETRLREQGADRGAHLRTVEDGRVARQIEAEIATEIGDRVRVPKKIRGLHQSADEEAWEELLGAHEPLSTHTFEYGLSIEKRPMAETIATGTVLGVKGRVLVLEHAGTTYAVDLRDLVGYELIDGSTDRSLQSSFAAFSGD